jgi:hypothetical protein
MAERLQRVCRRLGSASHCLHEWAEPEDERADIDDHQEPTDKKLAPDERERRQTRRPGRRDIRRWEDG